MTKQYKLIIFDVDGTLTTTKSGATFRKTADDWNGCQHDAKYYKPCASVV